MYAGGWRKTTFRRGGLLSSHGDGCGGGGDFGLPGILAGPGSIETLSNAVDNHHADVVPCPWVGVVTESNDLFASKRVVVRV